VQPTSDSMPVFRQMPGAAGIQFAEIHTAFGTQCGLSVEGQIYCWGANRTWIFGAAQPISAPLAYPLKLGALQFSSMTAGGHEQICAIARGTSVVYCWGHNDGYQLGRAPLVHEDSLVRPMSGSPTARAVSTGNFITCIVDHSLSLRCAGTGTSWLGVVDPDAERSTIQPLIGGQEVVTVYAGDELACALTATGVAWCTGRNSRGRLGLGFTAEPASYMLRPVVGNHRFRELSVSNTWSSNAVCGITTDDELYCWGLFSPTSVSNRLGELMSSPVRILNGVKVRGIARYMSDMCVITLDGRALCW
jgi:alpha-tubulin suppressor-like RCC1 family protein